MMCDSPENIEIGKNMDVIKEEINISDAEEGPDQENNMRQKVVLNNNDCNVEDLEMMSRTAKDFMIEEELRSKFGDGVKLNKERRGY